MRVALNKGMKGNPKRTKARAKSKKCNTSSYILRNLGTTVCGTHPFTLQTKWNEETANKVKVGSGLGHLKRLIVERMINDKTFNHAHLLSVAETYLEMVP